MLELMRIIWKVLGFLGIFVIVWIIFSLKEISTSNTLKAFIASIVISQITEENLTRIEKIIARSIKRVGNFIQKQDTVGRVIIGVALVLVIFVVVPDIISYVVRCHKVLFSKTYFKIPSCKGYHMDIITRLLKIVGASSVLLFLLNYKKKT